MRKILLALPVLALGLAGARAQVIAVDFGRRLPTSTTGPMVDHAMAYDPARRVVVAWDPARDPGTLHEWDGASWQARQVTQPIPPVAGLRAAFDPNTGHVLFLGGAVAGVPTAEQWRWDGTSLFADGPQAPGPRVGHGLAGGAGEVILFGGATPAGLSGDTWLWNGTTWTRLPGSGPSPRQAHGIANSRFEDAVYVFGGRDAAGLTNDFWRLDLQARTWAAVVPGTPPTPREHAQLVEGYGGFMMLFGGVDARGRVRDEVFDYHVSLGFWQARGAVVTCRRHNASARDHARDEVVLHGGTRPVAAAETWTANPEAIQNFPGVARSLEYGRGPHPFQLSTDTNPTLGTTFVVHDAGVPLNLATTVIAFGRRGDRNDPLGFHLDPTTVYAAAVYTSRVAVAVPTAPSLSGSEVVVQAVALTPGNVLLFTNSMRAVLGTR